MTIVRILLGTLVLAAVTTFANNLNTPGIFPVGWLLTLRQWLPVGAVVMLVAISFLTILIASITAAFVEARQAPRRESSDTEDAAYRGMPDSVLANVTP